MFKNFGQDVAALITGVFTIAIIAVVLSNGANTANVITTFFSGLTSLLAAVIAPVTGGGSVLNQATGSNLLGAIGGTENSLAGGVAGLNNAVSGITKLENSFGSTNSANNLFAGSPVLGGDDYVDTGGFGGDATGSGLDDFSFGITPDGTTF